MADKKAKAAEPKEEPKAAEQRVDNSGLASLQGKTIDERMADLLADHKRMGAR